MSNYNMNLINIEVEDIDMKDYPDFCDAYIAYAEDSDGIPLTEQELDVVNEDSSYVYEQVYLNLY
jgi:hypothetical protein